jgi:RNA polymerase sigma factor (sigma-70 family)|tara:strand:- start:4443 stop:4913 length:471 start_codon:yes stop_codon:yes gene_type:complete
MNNYNPSESENQRIKENYGLVVSLALSFSRSYNQDLEDYIQVGLIGLLKAIRKHDPERSKLSTYATVCIRNEIVKYTNKNKKNQFNASLENQADNSYQDSFWEYEPDSLSEQERSLLYMKRDNYSYQEISEELEYSKSYTKELAKRVFNKINEANK